MHALKLLEVYSKDHSVKNIKTLKMCYTKKNK